MSSNATINRAAVNRANAQHSTGPKTAAGKANSRENAWRHGMRSERAVMPGEDPAEFDALRHDLRQDYRPVGHHEEALVERIAVAEWKRRRFDAAEADIMWSIMSCAEHATTGRQPDGMRERVTHVVLWANRLGLEKALDLLCRYRGAVDRDWNRALTQLERLQRRRERMAREAAEAEAIVRKRQRTDNGLSVRKLTTVLAVARRESLLVGLGYSPIARLTGAGALAARRSRGTDWPSPPEIDRLGSFGNSDVSGRRRR